MASKELMGKSEEYVSAIIDLAKPGTNYRLMQKNIGMAHSAFEKYDLPSTKRGDREKRFNQIAATYLGGAFGIGYDSPDIAGGQMKTLFNKLPDGAEALGRAYNAIERNDKVALENELKRALEAQGGNKLETTVTELRDQPDEVKLDAYGGLARLLSDVDGYTGSTVSVAENLPGALQGLQQRLATADAFGKLKPAKK